MKDHVQTREQSAPPLRPRRWSLVLPWLAALALTYAAGRLAVDVAKWVVLMYLAPTAEAKLILVSYLASAMVPVLLLGIPAGWIWLRLFRSGDRGQVGLTLLLEVVSVALVDFRAVQEAVANYLN